MPQLKLTNEIITHGLHCPSNTRRIELCDTELPGLYIEIRATSPGQGTYYLRYKDAHRKTCHQKIGRTTDTTLTDARKRAKNLKAEIQLGADPRGEVKAAKAVIRFGAFMEGEYLPYVKPRKRSWRRDEELYRTSEVRIDHFPPPLVADDTHLHRIVGHLHILNFADGAAGYQNQHHRDENRNHRPRQLDIGAAVNLRRLSPIIVLGPPELHDNVDEQSGDNHENDRADDQNEHGRHVNHFGRPREGLENIGHPSHRIFAPGSLPES